MQGKFEILLLLAALYVACAKVIGVAAVYECPEHEEFNLCGEFCEPSCELPNANDYPCPFCTDEDTEDPNATAGAYCRCKSGYVRDSWGSGDCILEKDCDQSIIPPNRPVRKLVNPHRAGFTA